MTQDEIIEMARQAGLATTYGQYGDWVEEGPRKYRLVAFAKLVAQAEREACAKMLEDWNKHAWNPFDCAAAIRARGDKA